MLEYYYAEDTKEYTGSGDAFIDPLESEKQGKEIYLFSGNSTTIKPLEPKDGFAVVWGGNEWLYMEDHRGKTVWKSYSESMEIIELGPIPDGWTEEQPEKPVTHADLTEFLYQEKCKVAYGGVTVVKGGAEYLFETNQDSITMCNSMALAMTT